MIDSIIDYPSAVTIMESKVDKEKAEGEELEEKPQRYKRRGIVSNWSRYEETDTPQEEEVEDGSDYFIGEDFADVLSKQSESTELLLWLPFFQSVDTKYF